MMDLPLKKNQTGLIVNSVHGVPGSIGKEPQL